MSTPWRSFILIFLLCTPPGLHAQIATPFDWTDLDRLMFDFKCYPTFTQPRRPAQIRPVPAPIVEAPRAPEAPIQIPVEKTFAIEGSRRGPHGPLVTWNGCAGAVRGGFGGSTSCGKAELHPKLAEHLNKNFLRCVHDAATTGGFGPPAKVHINHMGSFANRNVRGGGGLSQHAFGKALDISGLMLTDSMGKQTKISFNQNNYNGATAKFYDRFRDCWRRSIPRTCAKGSIGCPKSKLGGNSQHHDHIHLEFPSCAG